MASFGEELRRQRELRAVSLREISDATKINIRFLEALEQNDFKHLPGGQFNKGFIRAYARHIGVSGDDMVNAYLLEMKSEDDGTRPPGRVAPVHETSRIEFNPRIMVAAAIAILALGAMAAITVGIVKSARRAQPGASSSERAKPGATPTTPQGQPQSQDSLRTPGAAERAAPPPPPVPGEGSAADAALPPSALPSPGASQAPPPDAAQDSPDNTTGATGGPGGKPAAPAPAEVQPAEAPRTQVFPPSRAIPDADASAAGGKLALRVIPFHAIRFDLLCNGTSIHSGVLAVGVPVSFECSGVYEVSLEDAGAVSMTVNGDRIYLGRPGQPLAGRHISAANYRDFTNAPSEAIPR